MRALQVSKNEQLGLVLVAAALLAIVAVGALFLRFELQSHVAELRIHGNSLVRILSNYGYDELVNPSAGERSPLRVLEDSGLPDSFAYVAIVDLDGRMLAKSHAQELVVPPEPLESDPSYWLGERVLAKTAGSPRIREFHAPILRHRRHAAYLRVGFVDPGLEHVLEHIPLLAKMALVVFLLVPIYQLLLRTEIGPVATIGAKLRALADAGSTETLQVDAPGQAGEFVQSFNRFVTGTRQKIRELEGACADNQASSSVIGYQLHRLEVAFEALPAAALLLDEEGVALHANQRFAVLAGSTPHSIIGSSIDSWCRDSSLAEYLDQHVGVASPRPTSAELALGSPQQTKVVESFPLVPHENGPDVSGVLIVVREPSGQPEQVSPDSEFISHMSHELKAPLNALMMYSEALAGKDGEKEEFRIEACNVITDEVERLSSLINTLLAIAKIEMGSVALERGRVRLEDLLRDAMDVAQRAPQARELELHLEADASLPPIYVDKGLLRVAVNNLLTNAVKYNRPGGEIRVVARDTPEAVVIEVADTGIGIALEEQPRIFERFFRSDCDETQERSGHGLGLTLAKQIIELHSGTIRLQSERGSGSTFSIVLTKSPALLKEQA